MKKIIIFTLLMVSQSAFAGWALDEKASSLNFITTKNASKTEVQSFKEMQGQITDDQVSLTIDLSSVDTGIEIRDERIKSLFFKVISFPEASATIKIAPKSIKLIKQGQSRAMTVEAIIDLYGVKQTVPVNLQVTALKGKQLLVYSKQPVIVNLKDFNLLPGVNALREIAKLQSINSAVPVTFSLLFKKK